ncbi:MAG: hypothetical protein EPN98_06585 [Phenylobacterium sp.]|uniref:hypothetical protein n=1 Tax=Phenylobacterium sp. TaxID=1871053 RepID=UPI00120698FD|nr:hypothetical protein [Phenylobacterium sp.]TAL35625.1 MAG: hypothetical protein EPN98_06585 [Phenylobacterium sp.]
MSDAYLAGLAGNPPPGNGSTREHAEGLADLIRIRSDEKRAGDARTKADAEAARGAQTTQTTQTWTWEPPPVVTGRGDGQTTTQAGSGSLGMVLAGLAVLAFGIALISQMIQTRKAVAQARAELHASLVQARTTPEGRQVLGAPRPWYDPFKWSKRGHTPDGDFFDAVNPKRINDEQARYLCGSLASIQSLQLVRQGGLPKAEGGEQFIAYLQFSLAARASCIAGVRAG